jgi:predicted HicB family RNase H-like nuclease
MMDNVFKYKGYVGSIEYDDRDKILHGRVLGISDVISYEGGSVAELEEDFRNALESYFEGCREVGKEPEKPFSGKFTVRVPSGLHAEMALKAKDSGKSLNSWVVDVLAQAVGHEAR